MASIDNLPKIDKNPNEWIIDFCWTCGKCIRNSLVQAFGEDEKLIKGKCIGFREGCSLCIVNYPFFIQVLIKLKSLILNIKTGIIVKVSLAFFIDK